MLGNWKNSNPHGQGGAYFGYSEIFGGYPGGQAEYMRVPYGNFTPFRIPDNCELNDETAKWLYRGVTFVVKYNL